MSLHVGATAKNVSVLEEVVQNMERKLAPWKKKFLNKAGMLVLIKSCLSSLPIYFLSLIKMPAMVELKLTRLMRKILCDEKENKKKMCWVSWDKICKLKNKGGLGVKNMRCTSKALKAKWVWRYIREKKALWRRVIQEKFHNNVEVFMPNDDAAPQGRIMWKNILQSSILLQDSVGFNLNNGKSIRFWRYKLTSNGPLEQQQPWSRPNSK